VREADIIWQRQRDRFLSGELDSDDAILAMKRRNTERALDALRAGLDRLLRRADSAGLRLCLRNSRRLHELPTVRELEILLGEFRGAPIEPLLDVGRAHLLDVMGYQPMMATEAAFGSGSLRFIGDACGPIAGLAPFHGMLGVASSSMGDGQRGVFNPWPGLQPREIERAYRAWQERLA
jgi:hypothetical protein